MLGRCLAPYQAPLAADAQQKPRRTSDGTTLRQPEPLLWCEVFWLNDGVRTDWPLVQMLEFDPAYGTVDVWRTRLDGRFDGNGVEWLEQREKIAT